jgi:hypothetical protein
VATIVDGVAKLGNPNDFRHLTVAELRTCAALTYIMTQHIN